VKRRARAVTYYFYVAKRRMIKGENENNVLDVDWCLVCASRLNDRDRESLMILIFDLSRNRDRASGINRPEYYYFTSLVSDRE
jgi:hypothetical protein